MRNLDTTRIPGQIGPFRLVRKLGAGGMAEAFEGLREGPGGFVQRVCIKRVLPGFADDEELVRLFLREARVAASLSHRNITSVIDFGEDAGAHYLALELVDGLDLRALLRRMPDRRLPVQIAVLVATEIAEALEHAHTRGGRSGTVVHRDISPANILVSVDGDVKLTDFGISKALGDPSLTRSDMVRGNVWYMAPELLLPDGVVSPRADLYSLGVVLYKALSGRRPYDARTNGAAMIAAANGERVPLRAAAQDLPEPIYMLVDRLLSLDPEARFPDARALIDSLAPLTRASLARRALKGLVRDVRARGEVAPVERPPVDREVPETPASAYVAPRWRKHSRGPGAWSTQSLSRLGFERLEAGDRRELDPETPNAEAPSVPFDWKLGAVVLFVVGVATFCVAAWAAI